MNGWQFARAPQGWEWHRLGENGQPRMNRSRAFASLLECLEDATRHGYSVSVPGANVRPESPVRG